MNQTLKTTPLRRLGRFHITQELGRGTLGAVFLGRDPVIDRNVAIKTFNPNLHAVERRQYAEQFINEARAAGRLSHPNIVTIFEASNEGADTYIAMELLQGSALNQMLDEGQRFDFETIASIGWKLADALDHAHRHRVIHRDIKPANIFLVDACQPKLVDFGIARAPNPVAEKGSGADAPTTLFRNNRLGTPNYMSPEQATSQEVDHRTDIYSLGAVLYEMLTGRKPFLSRDTDKLLQMIAAKTPPKPHELNPAIPAALSRVVMKAMQKQADRRYQRADEMTQDLKRFLMEGKRARRHQKMSPENFDTPRRPILSHRRKLVIAAFVVISVASLVIINGKFSAMMMNLR